VSAFVYQSNKPQVVYSAFILVIRHYTQWLSTWRNTMLHDMKKTTLTIAMLLTGIAAATAQAGDIQPLHHSCYNANAANFPKPSTAGPANTGGGSGVLGAAVGATDKLRFTCPVGYRSSFEGTVRTKSANWVRAVFVGLTSATEEDWQWNTSPAVSSKNDFLLSPTVSNAFGNSTAAGNPASVVFVTPTAGGTVDVTVTKLLTTNVGRTYELCVQCESATGVGRQPTAVYLQGWNQ
jgi:hypothetical protein